LGIGDWGLVIGKNKINYPKVKSQKSKPRQHRIVGDLEWLVYLRCVVLGRQGGIVDKEDLIRTPVF
jgi:hypothetical protein